MAKSGYVCAGFETLATIVDSFVRNKKNRFDGHFTRDDISKFLSETCSGFLHSFGQNFNNKRNYDNYISSEAGLFRKCRETGFFNKSNFIVDSGGFQASIGRINKNETRLLIDLYHKFLVECHDVYDRAFILDLPPGPGCVLFDDYKQVFDLNLETYKKASELPQHVRDKIIYIHHFRTPKLWDIYSKIMKDHNLFDKFKYHGTGGIVANMASDTSIPCIIYVIPMIPLINQALKFGRKELNFHILGGANFRDILFYESFRIHVEKVHNLKLNITYDSSGLFKGLMVGRYLSVLEQGNIRKIDLRSNKLNLRYKDNRKVIDVFGEIINNLSNKHNFKKIATNEIYNPETNTFYQEVTVYSMFYMLDLFSRVQNMLKDQAIKLYPLFESGNIEEYNSKISEITQNLNSGKITKKQTSKSNSLYRSLQMLTNLDEEYCKYLVTRFLSKDEFTNLINGEKILTF